MKFLEKDLETIIATTDQELLTERGLPLNYDKILRQVDLGSYGIADLITIDYFLRGKKPNGYTRDITVTIFELKQNKINEKTLFQALTYYKGLKIFIQDKYKLEWSNVKYQIVLIGSEIDVSTNFIHLADFCPSFILYTYAYHFDGIWFTKRDNWVIKNAVEPKQLLPRARNAIKEIIRKQNTKDDLPF